MKVYQEITLLPDVDIHLYFLWQKVFQQIHLALAENKKLDNTSAIGISFPGYLGNKMHLGNKIRLFSINENNLNKIDIFAWLSRFTDYVHITQIRQVPEKVNGYIRFSKKSLKSNVECLVRRRAKRKNETLEDARKHFSGFQEERTNLPFINTTSLSGDKKFRLFIEKQECNEVMEGSFNCYGLSKTATVPWF